MLWHYNILLRKPGNSVIVVDDELDDLELLSEHLAIKGFRVVGKGYDGLDAVELYKKLHPDFTLLDLIMPKYDGFYAIRNIKQIDPNASIVIITGDVTINIPALLQQLRGIPIVYKPYEVDDLVDIMHRLKTWNYDYISIDCNCLWYDLH